MDTLHKELTGGVQEANFALWQSLITVNSFLAALFITLANFKQLPQISKYIVFIGFYLSAGSCILLIANFFLVKKYYLHINGSHLQDSKIQKQIFKERIVSAKQALEYSRNIEIASVIISFVAFLAMLSLMILGM